MTLDSYECVKCGAWSHFPPPIDEYESTPDFCPYCGHEALRWRSDDFYALAELNKEYG